MNRKTLTGITVAALLFVSFRLEGSVDALKQELSSIRRVVIDGRTFVPDETTPAEGSLPERELARMGVRLPDGFALPEEPNTAHPAFSRRLKDSPSVAPGAPRLPTGLIPEHTLRMEGKGAPVDLVFGKIGTPGPSIRSRLLASGWRSVAAGKEHGTVHVLQSIRGKETAIVCLDEAEGTFLHIREGSR